MDCRAANPIHGLLGPSVHAEALPALNVPAAASSPRSQTQQQRSKRSQQARLRLLRHPEPRHGC